VNAPIAPIVHYRSVNSLDRNAYEDWTTALGGVLNYWSLTGAHLTQRGPLTPCMHAPGNTMRGRKMPSLRREKDSSIRTVPPGVRTSYANDRGHESPGP
jgi:hypothetical protein